MLNVNMTMYGYRIYYIEFNLHKNLKIFCKQSFVPSKTNKVLINFFTYG